MPKARSFFRFIDDYRNLSFMIIKGLFRRYERWNPVHPTLGAFWGMGIGIGCGVGWGPGFGPEVIGYVGAGCGVGFSVGVTLAGVGIGLPSGIPQIPHNAFLPSTGAQELTTFNALTTIKSIVGDSWSYVSPRVSSFKEGACRRLARFKIDIPLAQQSEIAKLNQTVAMQIQSTLVCLEALKDRYLPPAKGR